MNKPGRVRLTLKRAHRLIATGSTRHQILVIFGEIAEMTAIPLTDWMQECENNPDMDASHARGRLDVLGRLSRHAVEQHGIETIYIHAVTDHARCKHAVRCRARRWGFQSFEYSSHFIGSRTSLEFKFVECGQLILLQIGVQVALDIIGDGVKVTLRDKVGERRAVEIEGRGPRGGAGRKRSAKGIGCAQRELFQPVDRAVVGFDQFQDCVKQRFVVGQETRHRAAARLEDYSPELWALTGSKGAAVTNMLRYLIGDDKFFKVLKDYAQQYVWKTANTDDFRAVVEKVTGKNLGYFFLQWIESSGAPEFKLDYTIYRTQKGFRVMGKVTQDMDTFRMPVDLKIETEGNPERQRIEVVGTSSEFWSTRSASRRTSSSIRTTWSCATARR